MYTYIDMYIHASINIYVCTYVIFICVWVCVWVVHMCELLVVRETGGGVLEDVCAL